MAKPLIGLSGPSSFTDDCVDMVEEFFDADFAMLYHNKDDNLKRWVERCDAVCLAGGVDIHPSVYDNSVWNNQGFSRFSLRRDVRELKILEWCDEMKKPYLGICRGHQVIGVRLGLFLLPDLTNSTVCHNPTKQGISLDASEPLHAVKIVDPEEFARIFGWQGSPERKVINRIMGYKDDQTLYTNSWHHQGLAYLGAKKTASLIGPGVTIYGTARIDMQSVKEIVELMGGENFVSCQWHPETDWRVNSASRCVLERFKTLVNKSMSNPGQRWQVVDEANCY